MFALAIPPVCFAACALVCAFLIGSRPALAQDADVLIKPGVELRREGKDQVALEEFRPAFDVAPTPRALAQIALAEEALGRWIDAEAHIGKARGRAGPWIRSIGRRWSSRALDRRAPRDARRERRSGCRRARRRPRWRGVRSPILKGAMTRPLFTVTSGDPLLDDVRAVRRALDGWRGDARRRHDDGSVVREP
jgi:hypothetical protein